MIRVRSFSLLTALALALAALLISCSSDVQSPTQPSPQTDNELARAAAPAPPIAAVQSGNCGDPDPSTVELNDAFFYDVDGADIITVIDDPFPDDSLIGHYVAIRMWWDVPIRYFRIVGNEHFDQWNISVFTVDVDLEATYGSTWWFYDPGDVFDIVAPIASGANVEDPTFVDVIKSVKGNKLRHVSAATSFPNGSQVGQWIGVTPEQGQPDQYFEITANTSTLKPNGKWLNVFVVDGDLYGAGESLWWKDPGQNLFTIYEPCN